MAVFLFLILYFWLFCCDDLITFCLFAVFFSDFFMFFCFCFLLSISVHQCSVHHSISLSNLSFCIPVEHPVYFFSLFASWQLQQHSFIKIHFSNRFSNKFLLLKAFILQILCSSVLISHLFSLLPLFNWYSALGRRVPTSLRCNGYVSAIFPISGRKSEKYRQPLINHNSGVS